MKRFDSAVTRAADQSFILTTMALPLLTRDEEHALAVAWREAGDQQALHRLVRAYGRLVVAMAARYRYYGLPFQDLVQEGNVGLMLAAVRFDPARDVRFSTYAGWWVRSLLQDYVLRNWSIVRTGVTASHKSLFFKLRRLRASLDGLTGEGRLSSQTRDLIARRLGVPARDVEVMDQRLAANDQSLNVSLTEGSPDEWQDRLVDDHPSPEDLACQQHDERQRGIWLHAALQQLNQREQAVIYGRRLGAHVVTLEEMGHRLGVSKERVRQIETRAFAKLRTTLAHMGHDRHDLLDA